MRANDGAAGHTGTAKSAEAVGVCKGSVQPFAAVRRQCSTGWSFCESDRLTRIELAGMPRRYVAKKYPSAYVADGRSGGTPPFCC